MSVFFGIAIHKYTSMNKTLVRFINFVIDTILYTILIVVLIIVLNNNVDQQYIKWISVVIYFLYYFLFEYFLKQTPGKIITKTSVVSLTQNKNSGFLQIFLRTIMRFIPLDIISYLFSYRGFHDRISKTSITSYSRNNHT